MITHNSYISHKTTFLIDMKERGKKLYIVWRLKKLSQRKLGFTFDFSVKHFKRQLKATHYASFPRNSLKYNLNFFFIVSDTARNPKRTMESLKYDFEVNTINSRFKTKN